jgi:hypothetical protein
MGASMESDEAGGIIATERSAGEWNNEKASIE